MDVRDAENVGAKLVTPLTYVLFSIPS